MLTLVATIAFGGLGPVARVSLADSAVRAEIRYRIAHDRFHDSGEFAASPSIAEGTVTLVTGGRHRTYDLARIFPIHETHIDLPTDVATGCGATQPLTRRENYLVVEAVVAEKGCAPVAAFIDIGTGRVAEDVALDPQWAHRFDARPEGVASMQTLLVSRAETVTIEAARWGISGHGPTRVPWHFVLIHATDAQGGPHVLAFDASRLGEFPTSGNSLPAEGSHVTVGSIGGPNHAVSLPLYGERVVHLSASDDVRYSALQTPSPPDIELSARRNSWFMAASDDAAHERFAAAVRAFSMVVADDSQAPVDDRIRTGDAEMLEQCRALAAKVQAGQLTAAAASSLFQNGCKENPQTASSQSR